MTRPRVLVLAVAAALVAAAIAAFVLSGDDDGGGVGATDGDAASGETTSTAGPTSTTGSSTSSTSTTSTVPEPSTTSSATTVPETVPPAPPYQSAVGPVTVEQLGASWRPGCPVGPDQLRAIDLSYWGYDGTSHTGRLIIAAAQSDAMVAVFRDLYEARFPVQQIVPIDQYGGDDEASMRANNTSGFSCRYVSGTTKWSEHAYGRAVDVNPLVNPYVKGTSIDPPEGAPYADRSRTDPGMIHAGDAAVRAFAAQGWGWGGSWSGGKDYQHFSASGR